MVRRISVVTLLLASLLSGCSSEPVAMPSPQVTIYLLDLTGSGDAKGQFERIKDDLVLSMTRGTMGNPFKELGEVAGPTITRMYFVGTNSFALQDFKLQNSEVPFILNDYINEKNNQKRRVKFWSLLTTEYANYLKPLVEKDETPTKSSCLSYFDGKLETTWSSKEVRDIYSTFMCDMAVYSLGNFNSMKDYIQTQSSPGAQKASDVFGALSKIADVSRKYKKEFPEAEVKVVLATDGDHRLGDGDSSNLRLRLENNVNPCKVAEEVKAEYGLQDFERSDWLTIDTRGIAALTKGQGDYPRKLNDFWSRCFFPEL